MILRKHFWSAIFWLSCLSLVDSFNSWEVLFFWSVTFWKSKQLFFYPKFYLLSKWKQFSKMSLSVFLHLLSLYFTVKRNKPETTRQHPNSWNPSTAAPEKFQIHPVQVFCFHLWKDLRLFSVCIWYLGLLSKDFVFKSEEFGWKTNWEWCSKGKDLTA